VPFARVGIRLSPSPQSMGPVEASKRLASQLFPDRFVDWLSANNHVDKRFGHVYRYHSRSDAHSIALCREILADILAACPLLRRQAAAGRVGYHINAKITSPLTGKTKTLDLAIGLPVAGVTLVLGPGEAIARAEIGELLFSCEAKTVMTEHSKSKPRVYDELSSSHEIIHQGWPKAIATGITVVNIADTFVSPLRQTSKRKLHVTRHRQPQAAEGMVRHLRGLPVREKSGTVGFEAYATVVVECDNTRRDVRLWREPPAPQPGDKDHHENFISRIARFYSERFA